jgi:CRISPR system Cascade subunit CasE
MYLVELFLSPVALSRYAQERGLSARELGADPSYAVHMWLAESLGPQSVRPFKLMQLSPRMRVLGYSDESPQALGGRLTFNAAPSVAEVLEGSIAGKSLTGAFIAGQTLSFELKLLATRKTVGNVEKDAFLVECDRQGPDAPVDRHQVYTRLAQERVGETVQLQATVQGYELAPVVRKQVRANGARVASLLQVPQVHVKGTLQVLDAVAFTQLLRRGVGRGSGLGFGMLMLRRP